MASIVTNPGSMNFRMDTGEISGGKTLYKNSSLGSVKGTASAEVLAEIAVKAEAVLPWPVEQVTLRRSEILVY
ncbi:MAG: DUF1659 domain-containing protein [Synergistaceae bacterium]|nr:DUF1659 domain-containing protein [Synergistaceae bacterium]